ncbi:MAG: hypothetical protein ACPF9P_12920, partial [Thalassovita mediterranea]|uniref:antitoxin VbhA family protein n=1 Tax=Thalassovita mediterranea TaxID=340021 RepID=UPI003C3AB654
MPAHKVVAKKRLSVSMAPQRILASALASQRIEGLELDTRDAAEFSALAAGKMSSADLPSACSIATLNSPSSTDRCRTMMAVSAGFRR